MTLKFKTVSGWLLILLGIILIIFSPFGCKIKCIESCAPYDLGCFILFFSLGLILGVVGFILNIKKEYKKRFNINF
jgi:hypothetical protein